VPYLKSNLDNFYEELERSVDEQQQQQTDSSSSSSHNSWRSFSYLKSQIVKFYPYFHLFWSLAFWYFKFLYIFGKTDYSSPLLRLANLKLIYNNIESKEQMQSFLLKAFNYAFTGFMFLIQFMRWNREYNDQVQYGGGGRGAAAAAVGIESLNEYPFKSFVKSFLNLKSNSAAANSDAAAAAKPKPPALPSNLSSNKTYQQMTQRNLCPICSKKRRNESVLTVSGFVFCYTCIFKFVKEHKRCPITSSPCDVAQIIRIYSSAASD
jgi:hypothetical protein